jgi:hypothetical protein
MSITSDLSTVDDYVLRCAPYLADLSAALRSQFEEDIRQIVGEVTAELDGQPDDLVGPPERFVAELRLAAGAGTSEPVDSVDQSPASAAGDAVVQWLSQAVLPWLRKLASDLRPAWWVARGIGLAYALGHVTGGAGSGRGVVPDVFGSNVLGILAIAGLVFASVERGRDTNPSSRRRALLWVAASLVGLVGLGLGIDDVRYSNNNNFEAFAQDATLHAPLAADIGVHPELSGARYMNLFTSVEPGPLVEWVTSYESAREVLAGLEAEQYPASVLRLDLKDSVGSEFHSSLTYPELDAMVRDFFER